MRRSHASLARPQAEYVQFYVLAALTFPLFLIAAVFQRLLSIGFSGKQNRETPGSIFSIAKANTFLAISFAFIA